MAQVEAEKLELITSCLSILQKGAAAAAAGAHAGAHTESEAPDDEISFKQLRKLAPPLQLPEVPRPPHTHVPAPLRSHTNTPADDLLNSIDLQSSLAEFHS